MVERFVEITFLMRNFLIYKKSVTLKRRSHIYSTCLSKRKTFNGQKHSLF